MGLVAAATFVGFFVRQEMSTQPCEPHGHFLDLLLHRIPDRLCRLPVSSRHHAGNRPRYERTVPDSGVPLINSIFDLLEGHVLVGISRAVNALILIVCIALGLSVTLLILGLDTL